MKKSIYLLPIENGTYTACVGCVIPQKSAIVLTTEESYPASISIIEYDAYGAGRIYQKIVSNQTELVDCLCECGKQYCAIAKLWNFDNPWVICLIEHTTQDLMASETIMQLTECT